MNSNGVDKRRRYKCTEACTTCKRRKEKCDGNKPCARCIERRVQNACQYRQRQQLSGTESHYADNLNGAATQTLNSPDANVQGQSQRSDTPFTLVTSNASPGSIPETARLIQDIKGKYMFIGDSANLSLVQTMRSLISTSIGPCSFVEDPFRSQMVESVPDGPATWLLSADKQPPIKPSFEEATYLIRWYLLATNFVLDLLDESDLLSNLQSWLDGHMEQEPVLSATYYLVFAIGAQTCPEDKDAQANVYFSYGRYLTASYFTEDPSIATVQAYAMITMYLLNAARRNAAFMYLGTAVRAAYALGLHRSDIAALFSPIEIQTRERLWKVMRVLDLFLSASLGRPPSTAETRNTEQDQRYSAATDLCAIFEEILTDVYAKRMISTEILQKISQHHRRWTARFHRGLETDRVIDKEPLEGELPNIGLLHVKEAYYWTIILLTRPFFVECISKQIERRSKSKSNAESNDDILHSSSQVLVHACINSAISTINLLKPLLGAKELPKRLPFVVNATFVSGLILGLSYFGDMYRTYPLDDSFATALEILALFPNDAIARRDLAILETLLDACRTYVRRRANENMVKHAHSVNGMFGRMDNGFGTGVSSVQKSGLDGTPHSQWNANTPTQSNELGPQPGLCTHQSPNRISIGGHSDAITINEQNYAGDNALSLVSTVVVPELAAFQDDISMPSTMSPRTLWFGSYEDNMPFFSMIDARSFLE